MTLRSSERDQHQGPQKGALLDDVLATCGCDRSHAAVSLCSKDGAAVHALLDGSAFDATSQALMPPNYSERCADRHVRD